MILNNILFIWFNTNNVTIIYFIFDFCSSLTFLNLSNFNTNNVIYMNGMFDGVNTEKCKLMCKDDRILKDFNKK